MNRRTAINVVANSAGTIVRMLSGFIVMPFLIAKLGDEMYGLWALTASVTGYFTVLDLGLSASVGRLVAFHKAREEADGVNSVMSTALVLLCLVAVGILIATVGTLSVFFHVIAVPAEAVADVRLALLIVGANFALSAPTGVFYGMIWGYERFDIQNAIDIPAAILRMVLTLVLIDQGSSLIEVASIVLGVNILTVSARAVVCYRLEPQLKIGRAFVKREFARKLYSFGFWLFLASAFRSIVPQAGPLVVGNRVGPAAVTTFSIARQLDTYANWFLITATQVVAPRAVALHALNREEEQRNLFVQGGRYSFALGLLFVSGIVLVGEQFIALWQHSDKTAAYPLAVVLVLGELIPMSQWISNSTIVGMGQHRRLAFYAMGEAALVVALSLLSVGQFGILGVCFATALGATLFRGIGQLAYGCKLVGINPWGYARRVYLPILAVAALPIAITWFLVQKYPPGNWFSLIFYAVAYGTVFTVLVGFLFEPVRLAVRKLIDSRS